MAGKANRDSSVPIRRQPQHALPERQAHFGSFSFQTESSDVSASRPPY